MFRARRFSPHAAPKEDMMTKLIGACLLLTLAACGSTPPAASQSDCAKYGRGSMQCQIEMYAKAGQ